MHEIIIFFQINMALEMLMQDNVLHYQINMALEVFLVFNHYTIKQ